MYAYCEKPIIRVVCIPLWLVCCVLCFVNFNEMTKVRTIDNCMNRGSHPVGISETNLVTIVIAFKMCLEQNS